MNSGTFGFRLRFSLNTEPKAVSRWPWGLSFTSSRLAARFLFALVVFLNLAEHVLKSAQGRCQVRGCQVRGLCLLHRRFEFYGLVFAERAT